MCFASPIAFFVTNASDWWKIWEYQIGMEVEISHYTSSFSLGLGEINGSVGWKDTSIELQAGVDKIGVGILQNSN